MQIRLAAFPLWSAYDAHGDDYGVVVVVVGFVFVSALCDRVQSLLGDKTLSPSPFPSLYVIVLLVADPEHVPVPYKTIAGNFV